MSAPLSLKPSAWPEVDQQLWHEATTAVSFLAGARPASQWSPRRRRIVEQTYGQWLSYLKRTGQLDPSLTPCARLTTARLQGFIEALRARVAPWSVAMMVQALRSMFAALDPGHGEPFPAKVVTNLKRLASPTRDKRGHMVAPSDLYALGRALVARADQMHDRYHSATMARDGVMIAALACCPVRIGNLTQISVGRHLRFDGDRYLLTFSAEETKTRRSFEGELPPEMTPLIDQYLQRYRPRLLNDGGEPTNALWIDRWGQPMQEHSIRAQIKKRTRDAFGRHVWPHLFRSIAASGFVDLAPDEVSLLPDLLGHADAHTSHRHYVLANGTLAHQAVQNTVLASRAEAMGRMKGGK